SGYLKRPRTHEGLPEELVSRAISVASEIAEVLKIQGRAGTQSAIQLGCNQCKIMRQYGPTCEFHRMQTESLDPSCIACHTQTDIVELQVDKSDILIDMSRFFNIFASEPRHHRHIPEIGLQLVYSALKPQGPSDIAAFPGRIIKRKGRELLADLPAFSGSETISQFLLAIRSFNPEVRALMMIKSSQFLEDRLSALNLRYGIISGLEEDFFRKIEEHKSQLTTSLPMFLVGKDSIGYESITYLLAQNMDEVIATLQQL
ncbi:MAG: thiamine-phosphate synthase family protein, partial [Candidatus Kariarchaeaceae archaeon]